MMSGQITCPILSTKTAVAFNGVLCVAEDSAGIASRNRRIGINKIAQYGLQPLVAAFRDVVMELGIVLEDGVYIVSQGDLD